jgi:hypothetical protein
MNTETIAQQILTDLHAMESWNTVVRKVFDAMRFHRREKLYFTDRTARFQISKGKVSYRCGDGSGLPDDIVGLTQNSVWIFLSNALTSGIRCRRIGRDDIATLRNMGTASLGTPYVWAWGDDQLELYPSPTIDSPAEIRYTRDVGIPATKYESGSFNFYAPPDFMKLLTNAEVSAWSNSWTTSNDGAVMIRHRALYEVAKYLKDAEGANTHMASWLEERERLFSESESRMDGDLGPRPYLMGEAWCG